MTGEVIYWIDHKGYVDGKLMLSVCHNATVKSISGSVKCTICGDYLVEVYFKETLIKL